MSDPPLARRSTFRTLLATMLILGALVGVAFPPFARLLLDSQRALSPAFWAACVGAGLLVGAANYLLFHAVVSGALRRVATAMGTVVARVEAQENETGTCGDDCLLEHTSDDAIGAMELAFNRMTSAIARRLDHDRAVRELLGALADQVQLEGAGEVLLEHAARCCGAPAGALYVDDGNAMTLVATRGIDRGDDLPRQLDARHGLAHHALTTGELVTVRPELERMEWFQMSTGIGTLRPRLLVLLPLRSEQRGIGLAVLAGDADRLDPVQREVLLAIRDQGSPHVHNAVLHGKLQALAAVDELTGILNRRFGMRRLDEEFSRAMRHGLPLSVLLIDVDHFKRVNDDYGHDAGDEVLRTVAATLDRVSRSGDVVCRYGGEEFVVVAPGTGTQDAAVLAHRLRRMVETRELRWGNQRLSVTVSIGMAPWPVVSATTGEELVAAADAALYHAKSNGRNCVSAGGRSTPRLLDDPGERPPLGASMVVAET